MVVFTEGFLNCTRRSWTLCNPFFLSLYLLSAADFACCLLCCLLASLFMPGQRRSLGADVWGSKEMVMGITPQDLKKSHVLSRAAAKVGPRV
jgi:hypothetical protein